MKDHKTENVYFYYALIDRDGVVNDNAMEVIFGFRLLDRAADYVYCHNYLGANKAWELRHLQCWSSN